jgi:EmrB/QacA subfamily drug resistance transporter
MSSSSEFQIATAQARQPAASSAHRADKPRPYLALAAALGSFLTSLDASAANAVLPLIRASFHTTIPMIEWVLLGELLVTSGLLLAFGRLGDQVGHKRIYLAGFSVFLFGCALCATAPGVTALIVFRIIQGIGSAMLLACSPALLVKHLPAERRGRALGLRASLIYLGLVAGPAMGGWLAGHFGWRAAFSMQLPIGMIGLLVARHVICDDPPLTRAERLDNPGAATWACGLAALLFALNRGNPWGWTSPAVLLALLLCAILLIAFLRAEHHNPNAVVDLTLFERSSFSLPVAALALSFVSGYLLTFLLPFYLMQGRNMHSAGAGLTLSAYGLIRVVAAPLSGRVSDWIGARLPATFGAALFALGSILLSRLTPHSSLGVVIVCVLISGAGIGIFVPPNNSMVMGAVPRSRHGIAAGILATSRTVGMGIGIALAGVNGAGSGLALAGAIALLACGLGALARAEPWLLSRAKRS